MTYVSSVSNRRSAAVQWLTRGRFHSGKVMSAPERLSIATSCRRSCGNPSSTFCSARSIRGFSGSALSDGLIPTGLTSGRPRGEPIPIPKEEDRPEFVSAKRVLLQCEWFRIYDLIEDLFHDLDFHDVEFRNPDEDFQAYPFQRNINDYFEYAGIGWKLADGKIVARGDDAFERTVQTAEVELKDGGRTTAADCIEDAIRNLSFRPKPRLGAAVARATNAMECVLHDITAEEKMTLGDYLKRYPHLFPGGLAGTLGGLWGYASNEGARHGKEGVEPPREEAEFIVATAAALTTYLNRKHPRA